MKLFQNDIEGIFISRPNRFIVTAKSSAGIIRAHCPNPGRLQEILVKGRRLIFQKSTDTGRRTEYTLVAARYRNKIIPLYSAKANEVAEKLVIPVLFPRATKVQPEQRWGNSRFDFLITEDGHSTYLEVKACSLSEEKRGMFPDAPTLRGKRHVDELAELAEKKFSAGILFIITHPDTEVFTPNIHTDPGFSTALYEASSKISLHAVSITCTSSGYVSIKNPDVEIDFKPMKYLEKNTGAYLLVITMAEETPVTVGKLGRIVFEKGFYVYCGSAKRNLSQRVKRHLGKRKRMHWHIDYLTSAAEKIRPFPVFTGKNIECTMADDIRNIGGIPVPGFGASDCTCRSHLFYFSEDPAASDPFQKILHRYRHTF